MSRIIEVRNINELIQRYQSGESILKLSGDLGISRGAITNALKRQGIHLRTQSESEKLKWSKMTPEQRVNQISAYHDAIRGGKRGSTDLNARAISRQRTCSQQSATERIIVKGLKLAGIELTPQLAVGKYNLDIAIQEPPVAVEIIGHNGRKWTSIDSRYHRQRIPYLLDEGWHVLMIIIDNNHRKLTEGAINYIITFTKELRAKPALWREYRVISGNGDFNPALSKQFNGGA